MGQPPVNTQSPQRRIKNFEEVALGFSKSQALDEARRCIQCANPVCTHACPLGIDIPGFIRAIRENEPVKALARVQQKNFFSSICGRLCPAPCEKACVFEPEGAPIAIRALERFSADNGKEKSLPAPKPRGKKVAVIGAGPAGMTAAVELARQGFQVTVFDCLSAPGGALRYGVPNFRFPRKLLETEISIMKSLGVQFRSNFFLGSTATIEELISQGFGAVLLATGGPAGRPARGELFELPGAHFGGVYYAEEFLMRLNLWGAGTSKNASAFHVGSRVVIVGSGYAALDCARAARRLGKKATVIFAHIEDEMPVRVPEKEYAKEEGVTLEPLVKVLEIVGNDHHFVSGVQCLRMDFADPESSGQWKLINVPGSEFTIEADTVILAAHQRFFPPYKGLESEKDGMTSMQGVFAVPFEGGSSIVEAMAAGKTAAQNVKNYLAGD